MEYIALGSTEIIVSRLCFGTLTISPLQRNFTINNGAALLESAYDLGVTFFDTAEIYGTYGHIKKAFAGNTDVVISTKCYAYDEATACKSLELARREMDRDYIDLFMLHEQESAHTLRGHREAIDFFLEKKQEGVIGAFGVSTHFVACARAAAQHNDIDVIHPIVNISGLGIADGTRAQMEEALWAAHDNGKGIFAMKPLGGGHLYKQPTQALSYAADSPFIHSVAVGMQSEQELQDNCAFFSGQRDIAFRQRENKRQIMIHEWCTACASCVGTCSSGALKVKNNKIEVDQSRCVFCGYCGTVCPNFAIKVV